MSPIDNANLKMPKPLHCVAKRICEYLWYCSQLSDCWIYVSSGYVVDPWRTRQRPFVTETEAEVVYVVDGGVAPGKATKAVCTCNTYMH